MLFYMLLCDTKCQISDIAKIVPYALSPCLYWT